jgi:hypothetical protein
LGREDWRAGSQSDEIQREIGTVGPNYEKNTIVGPDSGDLEVRQSDVERRNIGAEEVEIDVELMQVGHTDAVSRRRIDADCRRLDANFDASVVEL